MSREQIAKLRAIELFLVQLLEMLREVLYEETSKVE